MFDLSPEEIVADEGRPLYGRIALSIERAIASGALAPGSRLPTHQQMAGMLGVTTLTVSRAYRVLTGRGLIHQRRKLGSFVVDDALRQLRRRRRQGQPLLKRITISIGQPHLAMCHRDLLRLTTEMLHGLDEALGSRRVSYHYVAQLTQATLSRLDRERGDALVAIRSEKLDGQAVSRLQARGVPVLKALNSALSIDAPALDFDIYQPVRQACGHLLECGYRRLGYIGTIGSEGMQPDMMVGVKFLEFANVLERAGLDFDMSHVGKAINRPGQAYETARRMIHSGDLPEAFFVETDYMAMEVIAALKHAGLRVPEDVGIASMDNVADAATFDPPLTSAATGQHEMGKAIGQMLLAWYDRGKPLQSRTFASRLCVRQSTAPLAPEPAAADV